tara:strand:+ start:31182 stop:31667 length:486 start_codon:yes stop_codon:yes gene_type:complete
MDNKKALIIGGSVAAGSLLLYFLLRKRGGQEEVSDDYTPLPTQAAQPENPFAILFREGLALLQKRQQNRKEQEFTKTEGEAVSEATFLKRGMKAHRVVALQRFLNQSSGAGLATDGDFGKLTEDAVKAEQDPFSNFLFMYPNSVYGAVSKTYYDMFVKSFE